MYALIDPEPAGRERRTKHTWGPTLEDQELLPWPRVVLMEVGLSEAMLYRYSADGSFGGDTWHESDEAARDAAAWEYGGLIADWGPVPDDADPTQFAIQRASDLI
jgi:hypothetical protein